MRVELIDHMGDDLRVANAARVSFAKESKGDFTWGDHPLSQEHVKPKYVPTDADAKLIHYLAKHGHWSPFSHCFLTFRIKAPIFVARQLQKHQVGLAWNEVSRRYVDSEPAFYVPDSWRKRAGNVKQGSSDEVSDDIDNDALVQHYGEVAATYKEMIDRGIAPEQARMILPQSMYTEWYWSGSLYAFARVCKLRLDSHTQKETREVAHQIAHHLTEKFPVSYQALTEG
jgi:thymidylate synthase (FAD)